MLARDKRGNLYGTTVAGGAANAGTVFKLTPLGKEIVLHSFSGGSDGANPYAGVIIGYRGALYGTTANGGAYGYGTVYKIANELTTERDTI